MRKDSWNVAPRNQCLSPCSAPLTCSSRGPPAEAMGCRWGHQLCGVDGTSGKHFPPWAGQAPGAQTWEDQGWWQDTGRCWKESDSHLWLLWWRVTGGVPGIGQGVTALSDTAPPPTTPKLQPQQHAQRHSEEWSETVPAALPQRSSI